MTNIVTFYLACGDVIWMYQDSLGRLEKDAPPYYVPCRACSRETQIIYWEQRQVQDDVDLYNWLEKRNG